MTVQEIASIKEYQRDFKEKFNKRLEIDFNLMNEVDDLSLGKKSLEEFLKDCTNKYNADIDKILNRKENLSKSTSNKERLALTEYSRAVITNRISTVQAAKVIKRDRSCLYYFAGLR